MKKILVLTLGLLCAAVAPALAQKFGFCNSVALLGQMPEVKQADSDLQGFQTQLTKRGEQMVKEFQTKAQELETKKNAGTIAPKEYEMQVATLQADQENLQKYEQEVYTKLSAKREELYKPILDRVNKAMQDVAKELGYTLVFDSSTQVLLYADESLDVTKLVKTKLGIAN